MKHFLYFLAFFSALTFLVSCREMSTINRLNDTNFYDFSSSVPDTIFDAYVTTYTDKIYNNLQQDDITNNMPIDERSQSLASKIFYESLTGKNFLGNDKIVTHANDTIEARFLRYKVQQHDSIRRAFLNAKVKRRAEAQNTDIIRALLSAQKYIINDTTIRSNLDAAKDVATGHIEYKTTNLFVINSDMQNDEPGRSLYDLEAYGSLTKSQITERIDQLQKDNMIANLKGVFIIVNGATAKGKNASLLYENIELFWREYFKRSGGILVAYGYDSSLEIENFIKNFKR